ncbi:MAG TPA: AAA family ATPase [Clostridia bacterium]|nr:AAA family ATPase [Clostridia bacterium]
MYKRFFGLTANPFTANPDPRFLYFTPQLREAFACLAYGIRTGKGFVLLTGEVGTGKTTLLNRLLQWLREQRMPTAFIFNPRLTQQEFFHYMLAEFGIENQSTSKGEILLKLNDWLLERLAKNETPVLIIDEAQHLSDDMLEEIRLLTNLETSSQKLLQIVLCGQPELAEKIASPHLRQLRQRIALRTKTMPLSAEETTHYIQQRLRMSGAQREVFTAEAIAAVQEHAAGIPRLINLICENSLIAAFADGRTTVGPEIVGNVARDWDLADRKALPNAGELPRADDSAVIFKSLVSLAERLNERSTAVKQES